MKALLIIPALFALSGCTAAISTALHQQEPPRLDMIETATYKSAKSLEVSGWVSGIPNSSGAVDSSVDSSYDYVDPENSFDTVLVTRSKLFYYPRFTAGGSLGWNFSRYFGMGGQVSYSKVYDTPSRYRNRIDQENYRIGYYLRVGGPLGDKEKVSLVGNIKRSFGVYDQFVTEKETGNITDTSSFEKDGLRSESEYNLALQVRPVQFVGIFGGAGVAGPHILNRIFTANGYESQSELLFYGGLSIYPMKSLAISPWYGAGTVNRAGVRIEYMPSFE